jgi:ribose transport system permease protein
MAGCLAGVILFNLAGKMPEGIVVTIAIVGSLAAGAVIGVINGLVISKLRVLPFIATLGSMTVAYGVAMLLTGGNTISKLPDSFTSMGTGYILKGAFDNVKGVQGIPVSVIIMIVIVVIGAIVIKKTEFGLNIYAIGGNYKAARLAGLNNDKILMLVYIISGVLSALAGLILTARYISAQPGLWEGVNLQVIAGCVIGGTSMRGGSGSVVASLLGMLLMTCMSTGLNLAGIDYSWQQVVTGVLVIAAVSLDMVSRKKEV